MTAQITTNAKAAMHTSLETATASRPAAAARSVRLSMAGALLASSAMMPLHAQTFDIGGGTVVAPDFTGPPLNGATEITNGTLTIDTAAVLAPYTGTLSDSLGGFSLNKTGTGTVTLSGNNSYSGVTTISEGTLIAASSNALGSTAGNTVVSSGATLGVQGGIVASEALTLNGSGVGGSGALRSISGNNVLGGVITLGSASRINADADQINLMAAINSAGFNLTFGGQGNTIVAGNLNLGTGQLIKDGGGFTQLLGANVHGDVTINGGNLIAVSGAALDDGALVTMNGGSIAIGASETIGGLAGSVPGVAVAITAGQTLSVGANNASTTFAGLIFSSGALTKIGTGTLTLTGSNAYSGGTTISRGTIVAGNANALGTGSVNFNASDTKLVADFNGTFSRDLNVAGDATFAAATGRIVTFTGDILTGATSVINFGSATETGTIIFEPAISGNFDSTTSIALNGGTLRLGPVMNAINVPGFIGGTQGLTINSAGTFDLGGFNFASSKIGGTGTILNSDAASTLTLSSSTFAGTLDTGANGITLAGTMAGLGSLTKRGSGTLTLAFGLSTSGYSGGLTLAEGTLSVQGGLSAGFGTIRTTGSVIDYADGVTIAAPIAIDSDTTQLQVLTGNATQSGVISELGGARGFEKIGAGSLRLTGANTYTGITTVAAGTLVATTAASLGTATGGTTVRDGATLAFDGSLSAAEALTIAGNGVGGGGAIRRITGDVDITGLVTLAGHARINSDGAPSGDDFSFFGGITGTNVNLTVGGTGRTSINSAISLGTGSVIKDGSGLLALTGSNSFTGGLIVNDGFAQLLNGSALADTAAVTINSPGVLQVFTGETIGSLAGNGTVVLQTNQAFVVGDASSTTFSGLIEEFGATGSLTKQGTGTLTLTGNNTYSGTTVINGGTLQIGNGGTSGSLGTGDVVNNASLVFDRSNVLIFVSNVISGTGSVTKRGNSSLFLAGANSFSGGVLFDQGLINVFNNASLGTGTLTMGEGTRLLLSTNNLTLANDIVLGSGAGSDIEALSFNNPATLTGVLSGGQLNVVAGTGRLVLTGANTYGATTIGSSAVLQIGNGGTTGTLGSGNVVNNGALVFNRFDSLTVGNLISGTGSLTKQGAGALTLSGANTYTGNTALNTGRLIIGSNTALGTGTLTTQAGTTLQLGIATSPGVSAGPITLANAISLQGNTDVNLVGTTGGVNTFTGVYTSTGTAATLGGVIAGPGAMTVTGAGILTLNGNNSFSDGTNVSQALIEIGNANAFGTGSVTLGSTAGLRNTTGGALTIGNAIAVNGGGVTIGGTSNLTLTGNLSGAGLLSKVQGNTLAINGAVNDFAGGLIINGGRVLINGTMGNAGAAITINNGGTLGGTGTVAGGVSVNSGGTLAAGQSPGTMTLGSLTLNTGSNTVFELAEAGVVGGANNDLIRVTGNLALNGGGISVVRGTGFGTGEYTLFEFGALSGAIGNMTLNAIGGGFAGSLALGTNTVLLNVAGAADQVHWNGSTLAPAGSVVGGSGTWNLVNGNFSNAAGTVSGPWAGNGALAIFGGTAGGGTVTIADDTVLSPSGLVFETSGYTIAGGNAGSALGLTGPTGIDTLAGVSATIAAPISGAGSITKNGDGTLILTGANSYSGGTNILGGTLQVGDGGTAGALGGGDVLTNASLVFNRADDMTFGGVISGSGTLTQQGAGNLVLSGANTYDGLTMVAAGTLTVTNDLALGTAAAGTIVAAGATLALDGSVTLGEAITLNGGGLSGGGALRNGGGFNQVDGLITLASAARINSDSGFLTIAGGISGADHDLTFGGTAFTTILAPVALGTGRIIKDGTSLLSLFSSDAAISELVINAGSVQLGFDSGPVNSALADTAGVTINDGTLIIGASETIGALAGSASAVVTDQGRGTTLTAGANSSTTLFEGRLGDTIGLTKVGSGSLTLTGANTHAGVTRIEGGTLALGANDATSAASALQIAGGTLALESFTGSAASVNLSAGSVTGSTGSALTVAGDYTQSGGTLAAGATVHVGTGGMIRLSGATIAGVLNGSATSLNAALIEGSPASVTGSLQSAGGLVIGNTGTGSLTISNGGIVTNTIGQIGLGAGSQGIVAVAGAGSDWQMSGGLLLGGSGNASLTIAHGGAVSAASVSIGASAGGIGTLVFGSAEGDPAVAAGTLTTPTIALGAGSAAIIFNHTAADFALAAAISGTGTLRQLAGTTTLSGASTFTGTTSVLGGSLQVTGALASDVVVDAARLVNSGTIGGLVTNHGTLTSIGILGGGLVNAAGASASISGTLTGAVENAGTLTLNGATSGIGAVTQTASGVFALAGNSTAIGSLAGAGQVQLGSATLTTGSNNAATLYSGLIAGSGGLTKLGSGTFTLTGANTFTGTTTITGGALQLGDGGTTGSLAGSAISNNGALILNRSDAITLAHAVSGSGALVQAGTGITRLTAANSYTGGTLVSAGRLVGDTAALQGAIQNNGVLEFALPANGTFAGALTGTGRVEKTGAGILTFAADGRGLTGPFAVLDGTLRMDGANGGRLDHSVVTLAAGTTLSGHGLIGGLVVEGGALVTPGNSLGVIGVSGDVTFRAASRFLAQITESGADLITAGGTARLAGALDVVNLGAATYRFNTAFNLVEAAGGITGSFDAVTFAGFSPIYRPALRTTANGLAVVLAPGSLASLAGAGLTSNQAAVAARLDAAVAVGFDPQAFFGVYALAPAALAGALDQLSGEVHPAMGRAAMRQSRLPREAVLARAAGVALADTPQGNSLGTWAKLMRSWGDVAAAPGTAGQSTDTEGFVIGVDGGTANDARALRFGVYGSYLNTRIAIDARGSAGEIEQAGGGIYTSFATGGFSLVAGAGAARFDITTNRMVALPGLADSTASTAAGDMAQVFGRIGYRFALGSASLEPFAAADHAWIALDPLLERGGASALTAGRQEYKVAGATTGLALKAPLGKLRLDAEAAARFELGDRAPEALVALAAAPGAATRIGAPRLAGTAFTGRLGAILPITARMEVRFDYAGEFSGTDTEHAAQAGLSIRF
ncbi:MAG: autotransporter-associated beta strand repeat-containing protein [Erythrobacter sp.]